jgi:hypothetical protein
MINRYNDLYDFISVGKELSRDFGLLKKGV